MYYHHVQPVSRNLFHLVREVYVYHVTRLYQCLSNSETFNLNIFADFIEILTQRSCQEENIEVLRGKFYLSLHKFEEEN